MVVITLKFSLARPVETPIIFCSAIPKSIYFSGKVFLNRSKPADVDTSQVTTIKSSYTLEISKIPKPKDALGPKVDQSFIFFELTSIIEFF